MNWICPICSTANPKSERECFVCGAMRDEAEILAEAMAAEAARLEAERLARLEAERRAAEERRRAEEAERRRLEEERRAREAAERLARLEAERRRLAAEAAERAAREAGDRKIADRLTLICKIAMISSLSLFTVGAIGALVILAVSGSVGDVVPNIFTLVSTLWGGAVDFVLDRAPALFAELIPSSYKADSLNAFTGTVNRNLIELVGVTLPGLLGGIEAVLSAAAVSILALLSRMGVSLDVLSATVAEILVRIDLGISEAVSTVAHMTSVARTRIEQGLNYHDEINKLVLEKLSSIKN